MKIGFINDLYLSLGNGEGEITDIIEKFNKVNKNNSITETNAIIDNHNNCESYVDDVINKIKQNKKYKVGSYNKLKDNNSIKYFQSIIEEDFRINEDLWIISYEQDDNKNGTENKVKLIRVIEMPDNYKNTFNKNSNILENFKLAIKNYLFDLKCLDVFDTGIIQFFHPGIEHIVNKPTSRIGGKSVSYSNVLSNNVERIKKNSNENIMLWNDAPMHARKYIYNNGKYVTYDNEGRGILSDKTKVVFWGEWEPQSRVIRESQLGIIDESKLKKIKLKYLHEPLISKEIGQQESSKLQNTDPYVFGMSESDPSFYYCCCKQNRKSGTTEMQNLKIGDIILFGSFLKNKFMLDTVFVVGDEGQVYSQFGNEKLNNISDVYKFAVIDKVRGGNQNALIDNTKEKNNDDAETNKNKGGCITPQGMSFKLYKSESYNSQRSSYFSFFPCKEFKEGTNNFYPRVSLDLNKFGLCNGNQGCPKKTNGGKKNLEKENSYISQHFIKNYLKGMYKLPIEISNELDICIKKLNMGKVVHNFRDILNKCYWNALANEVIEQGYHLGVYAEEPKF